MNQKRKDQIKKLEKELLLNKLESKEGIHELVLILDHLKSGFNIAKIIRTAEAFSIKEVHIIGTKLFDPYPAKGAIKRVRLHFYSSLRQSIDKLKNDGYELFLMDMKAKNYIHETELPSKSAFIFGNEEVGPTLEGAQKEDFSPIKIKQWGLTESLNVSIAASITAYEYVTQTSES